MEEAGTQSVDNGIRSYLHDKRLLLLLDNFEQVLEAGTFISDLLATASGLTILITSRSVLRVSGEREFPVPPLDLPTPAQAQDPARVTESPAVALFLERARRTLPDFSLTAENVATVTEICVRVDGLPLAVELAAARLKVLNPDALLSRLRNRLELLTGGPRDLPARQQTLRNTIAWSYDLLAPEEQRLFRRLAPFVGGCSLAAAGAVFALRPRQTSDTDTVDNVDLLDRVTALVDKSLLRPALNDGAEPRFVMLETIRDYAIERLDDDDDAGEVRLAHARYFLDLIESAESAFFGGQETRLIDQLEEEHDNLRAALRAMLDAGETELALRMAGALAWFWYDHGYLSEGRQWLDLVLARAEGAPPALRAKALIVAGGLAHRQYDLLTARRQLEVGLALSRSINDDWNTALALINLGLVVHDQGDYARALRLHEESLNLCRAAGNAWGIGTSLSNLAWSALFAGDLPRARKFAEEALVHRRELHDDLGLAYTLYTLGRVALDEGNEAECRSLLAESIELFHTLGERWGIAACLEALAVADATHQPGTVWALRAARLWAAAEVLREVIGAPLTPADRRVHERCQRSAQARVDARDWQDAWDKGRRMSLEDVLAVALAATPIMPELGPQPQSIPAGLTSREVEVLRLVADGLTNAEVADRLSLSSRTIGQHLRSIYRKIDVSSRTAAARFAIEHDLL